MRFRLLAIAQSLVPLVTSLAIAQVPPNSVVFGTASFPTWAGLPVNQSGTTGLFVAPLPTTSNPGMQVATPISGLPATLTVPANQLGGTYAVRRHPPSGKLIVGPLEENACELYVLELQGTAVTATTTVSLGQILSGFGIAVGVQLFPDGRALISTGKRAAFGPGSGVGATSELAILDLAGGAPTLTPVPVAAGALSGFVMGGPITPDGTTAFVMDQAGGGNPPYNLYAVDVDTGSATFGAVTLLHVFQNGSMIDHPELRDDGILVVSGVDFQTAQTTVHMVDTSSAQVGVVSLPAGTSNVTAIAPTTDSASDRSVFASWDAWGGQGGPYANSLVIGSSFLGTLTPFVAEPAAGWCLPWSIDVHSAFERYGSGTPAGNTYRIVDHPNPGGTPELGNAGFSISLESDGGAPAAAWLAVGSQPLSASVLGVHALVAPDLFIGLSPASSSLAPIPIPNTPALAGASLFAQGLLLDAGGLGTSDAVQFTIVP